MKRIAVALVFIGNVFLLGACDLPLLVNYAPSNLTKGTGTVSVERFVYSAARQGKVDPNEVEKNPSGLGTIYLAEDIESLFTNAVRKELRFSGYSLTANDALTVGGVINRFYIDWVGFSADMDVAVTFEVRKDGKAIFSRLISSHNQYSKGGSYETEAIKAAISECIQRFLEEVHRQGVLGPNIPNRIAKSPIPDNLSSSEFKIDIDAYYFDSGSISLRSVNGFFWDEIPSKV